MIVILLKYVLYIASNKLRLYLTIDPLKFFLTNGHFRGGMENE